MRKKAEKDRQDNSQWGYLVCIFFLVTSPLASHAEEEASCTTIDSLRPKFNSQQIPNDCGPNTFCQNALREQVKRGEQITAQLRQACSLMQKHQQQAEAVSGQRESLQRALKVNRDTQDQLRRLVAVLNQSYEAVRSKMAPLVRELEPADQQLFADALRSEENVKRSNITGVATADEVHRQENLFAARNGTSFLRALALQKIERKRELDLLSGQESKVQQALASLSEAAPPPQPAATKSSFDPNTLLGLGSALTGLAGAAQKIAAGNADSSGLSGLNNPNGVGTSPTPDSPLGSSSEKSLASAKLGAGGSRANSAAIGFKPMIPPSGAPADTGGQEKPAMPSEGEGTLGAQTNLLAQSGSGIRSASATAGGSGGFGSFGASKGDGASHEPGNAALDSATSAAKEEETLQGFHGGSGMLGAPSGSSFSSTSEAPVEGEMQQILTDMRNVANDPLDAEGANREPATAGMEVGEMNGEELFARVRACYLRRLKKGLVFNGLGERIEP